MGVKNKHGLNRMIPADIARQIRRRCGFGCVACGSALYQYEHVDPPFAEARLHDPSAIVLLCGRCHDGVTRGLTSKETVKVWAENPKCKEQGFSFGAFDIGPTLPKVAIGSFSAHVTDSLIEVDGTKVLGVNPPEEAGGPFRIHACLTNKHGRPILRIENNHWMTLATNWDVEVIGTRITVRQSPGDIALRLRSEPPGSLIVERMKLMHNGTTIFASEGGAVRIRTRSRQSFEVMDSHFDVVETGIRISNNRVLVGAGRVTGRLNLKIDSLKKGNIFAIGGPNVG